MGLVEQLLCFHCFIERPVIDKGYSIIFYVIFVKHYDFERFWTLLLV